MADNQADVLEALRRDLSEFMHRGRAFVNVPALLARIDDLERKGPAVSQTRALMHESSLAQYRAETDNALEMLRAILASAKTAITSAILVNGGAVIGLLTFLGRPGTLAPARFATPIEQFAFGVMLAVFATGGMYVTQFCYAAGKKFQVAGWIANVVCVFLIAWSYLMLWCGIQSSYLAFSAEKLCP